MYQLWKGQCHILGLVRKSIVTKVLLEVRNSQKLCNEGKMIKNGKDCVDVDLKGV